MKTKRKEVINLKLIFGLSSDLNWTYNWLGVQIYKLTQQVGKSHLNFNEFIR